MSLISPTIWTQILVHKRLIGIALACIAGLLLLLYLFAGIDACNFNRGQNTRKEAVNAALEEIKVIESNINAEKLKANQLIEQIKVDTAGHLDSINATDAARLETNKALANLEAARTANRNSNVTAEQLERLLNELDK